MKKILYLFLFNFSLILNAQNSAEVLQNFGSIPGFDGGVYCIAIQNDGKIIVSGFYSEYRGVPVKRIARLNQDGSLDPSFLLDNTINGAYFFCSAIQSNGKILVGGPSGLIRLNTDGSIDTTLNIGTGFNGHVYSIEVQQDGKILVGGMFTTYNGITHNRLVRLNSNGIVDTSFYIGTGFGNTYVTKTAVQNDNKIIVIGEFNVFDGVLASKIVRLNSDGSRDNTFNTGSGFDYYWAAGSTPRGDIVIQNDGKILIGGDFNFFNGQSQKNFIRLNTDGTKDTSFNIGAGFSNYTNSIKIQSDGKILIGGGFSSFNNIMAVNHITRLNTDGTLDTSFNTQGGFNYEVRCIALQNDGNIFVGGEFTSYDGVIENKIINLTNTGARIHNFNTGKGFDTFVTATAQQNDGKIIVGGSITNYKRTAEKKIIRLNTDGTKDVSFNTGTGFNNNIRCIVIQNDGKIIIGGEFTSFNNVTENYIIRLNTNGTKDTSFNTGIGFNNFVNTITIQSDGKILIGGDFNLYKGALKNKIIRLNTDGSVDTSFNPGTAFDNSINSIVLQNDGKILVGGAFTSFDGLQQNRAIRLNNDGSKDTSFNIGTGFSSLVQGFALQSDGKIFVYGDFINFNNLLDKYIVRLNIDGTKDTTFNSGGSGFALGTGFQVKSVIVQNGGKIVIGGKFNSYNTLVENNIIRLNNNGTKDTSFNTGIGFNKKVNCLNPLMDGSVLIGGDFTNYNNLIDTSFLVSLYGDSALSNNNISIINPITIWPNPVGDVLNLNLDSTSKLFSIKIYDLQGKLILEDSKETLNVSQLLKGFYVVKIQTENGEFTKKFIKE